MSGRPSQGRGSCGAHCPPPRSTDHARSHSRLRKGTGAGLLPDPIQCADLQDERTIQRGHGTLRRQAVKAKETKETIETLKVHPFGRRALLQVWLHAIRARTRHEAHASRVLGTRCDGNLRRGHHWNAGRRRLLDSCDKSPKGTGSGCTSALRATALESPRVPNVVSANRRG